MVNTGVTSLILARSHTFVEIDHAISSMAILLPSADSRRVVVNYKRQYVHEVLVNCTEKSVVRLTDCPDMTIAVDWDVKHKTKPTKHTKDGSHVIPISALYRSALYWQSSVSQKPQNKTKNKQLNLFQQEIQCVDAYCLIFRLLSSGLCGTISTLVKVFRIIPEFRILRLAIESQPKKAEFGRF